MPAHGGAPGSSWLAPAGVGEQPDRDQRLQAPPRCGLGPIVAGIMWPWPDVFHLWRWAMARSWCRAAAQSRSRLPCVTARAAITPRRVMPTAWRSHTLTARINQQFVQAGYPGETTQCAMTEKLRGLPPISR
jgi:hypothetical protein